jgi:dipeptidyl aminopeptidase/acylaminoacyl peptidase
LLFVAADHVYQNVFAFDIASSHYRRLTTDRVIGAISPSRDGSRVAFSLTTPTSPTDIYVSDLTFASPKRVTTLNPQVASMALGETEVVTYKNDGLELEGILIKPVGYQAGQRYPLLVEAHGGPTGATLNDFKTNQVWAGRGWAVFMPNPRGSEGFGESFMRANINDLGGGDYRDIMAGVDVCIRRGIADSTRMAFEGWSYGGYMTAWVVGHTSRFKAARMGAGMSDLLSMYGTSEIAGYIGLFEGGRPSASTQEKYRQQSPLTYADRVTTPLLILHGASDPRVPPGQALEMYRALKDQGKPVELVLYPREQHALGEYAHQVDRMQRDSAWISRYTLGRQIQ